MGHHATFIGACLGGVILGAAVGGVVVLADTNPPPEWRLPETKPRTGRVKMGVNIAEPGRALSAQLGIDRRKTTVITEVSRGSYAERAGLRPYDIITAINGENEASPSRLRRAIRSQSRGDAMVLTVLRDAQTTDTVVVFDK